MEPLVAPGPPLTPEQVEVYARHLMLSEIGEVGQRRLLAARVCVVGAGGLGSPALLYLAAAGVGTLGIVDDDTVETSNLQRQVLHGIPDVGRRKLDSATEQLRRIAPALVVERQPQRLTAANAVDLLRGYHLVLDGTDTFETRYAVADACAELGVPLVWASVLGFDAQVSVFWPQAPDGVTLRDLFPQPPAPGSVPSCADAGVLGSLTGQVGSVMATEAIKLITGIGEPLLGRVLALDGLRQRWTEIPLRPARQVVASPGRPAHPARASSPGGGDPLAIDPEDVRRLLNHGAHVTFVDVRDEPELLGGGIPGALHVPLRRLLTADGRAAVPTGGVVVAYCAIGPRSQRAAALLRADGVEARWLTGGLPAWLGAELTA